ncbi:class I SAM-dependent methyltransferase [Kribbella soli]|uniref:Methyltransferase domain-containing protein n=1 Tax=Kribbella soli TaxID=1124743 RepID=A0A4R0HCL8_9ACTN|nr:methyltransferase domain-containing protein [Kribbella soli]TCC07973.1 methyltransferase domain-containing protein [Kribbella soli]
MTETAFTPALGRFLPSRFFDVVAALVREKVWRAMVVRSAAVRPGDLVMDVGCGTGTLALMLHQAEPAAWVVGVDPDPEILARAQRKAPDSVGVEWRLGLGDELVDVVGAGVVDVVVSSLVLHQCPLPVKRAILAAMYDVLRPGGRLVIADYGLQRTWAMRLGFRIVQLADGKADTQPNADGILPSLIAAAGFEDVCEVEVVPTVTGSISLLTAYRPL